MKFSNKSRLLPVLLVTATVSACSTPGSNLIVDGPRSYNYESDLAACREVSEQQRADNRVTAAGAVIGGLAGAAEADRGDTGKDALVGAAIGAAIGRGKAEIDVRKKRETIIANCMRGRGHRVVS